MSRENITSTYIAPTVPTIRVEYLAYLDFEGAAPVRLWTGISNREFTDFAGTAMYYGVGNMGAIGGISETTEVAAKNLDLTLSGVDSNYISLALSNNYRGRTVAIYVALFDSVGSLGEQTMIFRGRMDQMIINEGENTSTIIVKCESRLVDLNRARSKRYTDEYQKSLHPADRSLEFMAGMGGKSIYWGSVAPSATTVASPVTTTTDDGNMGNFGARFHL